MAININIDASSKQNKLVAGSNITIDETNPLVPIISASDGDVEIDVTPIVGGTDGRISFQKLGKVSQSSSLFWDNTNVRLGVGTSIPRATVHSASTTGGSIWLEDTDSTSTFSVTEISNNGGSFSMNTRSNVGSFVDTFYSVLKNASGATTHNFLTGGANRVTINLAGNLGVNQTAPTSLLHVKAKLAGSAVVARIENSAGTGDLFSVNEVGFQKALSGMFGNQVANNIGVKLETDTNARVWGELQLGQYAVTRISQTQLTYTASGADGYQINNVLSQTATTGTYYGIRLANNVAPTSGTAIFSIFQVGGIINQTGGANGAVRGLFINPTLTSAPDFRAIEVAAGKVKLPLTEYADNATALAALGTGILYKLADGSVKITQ